MRNKLHSFPLKCSQYQLSQLLTSLKERNRGTEEQRNRETEKQRNRETKKQRYKEKQGNIGQNRKDFVYQYLYFLCEIGLREIIKKIEKQKERLMNSIKYP